MSPVPADVAFVPADVAAAILAGPRPVYVYDPRVVTARIAALRAALPAGTLVAYAVKANGHPAVVAAAARAADALEVASAGELAAAVTAGARAVVYSGPAKSDDDLRRAVAAGAMINVESVHEVRRLAHLGGRADICLRVNRGHAALPGRHAMTGVATQFGLAEDDVPEAAAVARAAGLDVHGFHLHAVSNNLDAAAHAAHITGSVAWARRAARAAGVHLRLVNTGGGFGVDIAGDGRFDLTALRDGLDGLDRAGGVRLAVEPGRYVAADAGWYAADVVDVKRSHGRWFAVVAGGTHHFRLPASWGYSHPFHTLPVGDWPYPWPRPAVTGAAVTVAGEQCNPRDVLTRDQPVDALRAGDVVVYAGTGAYGWEVAHHDFLALPHPRFSVVGA